MLGLLMSGVSWGVLYFNKPSELFVSNIGELITWSDKRNIEVPSFCREYYDFHKGALTTKEDVDFANKEFLASAKSMVRRNLFNALIFTLLGTLLAIQVIVDSGTLPSILRMLDICSIIVCIYLSLKYYRNRKVVNYILRNRLISVSNLFFISAEAKAYVFGLTKLAGEEL